MSRKLTLCLTCAGKLRGAYELERTDAPAKDGKCDECHKKLYVAEYEVKTPQSIANQ